jgi:hypothetical protein
METFHSTTESKRCRDALELCGFTEINIFVRRNDEYIADGAKTPNAQVDDKFAQYAFVISATLPTDIKLIGLSNVSIQSCVRDVIAQYGTQCYLAGLSAL